MNEILSNVLDLEIVLEVDSNEVRLAGLSSNELPWLADPGEPNGYPLRAIIEGRLLALLNSSKSLGNELVPTIETMLRELVSHLRDDFEICCEFRPHVLLEELEEGALDGLRSRLKITDIESTRDAIASTGTLDWKPSDAVSKEKACEADFKNKFKVLEIRHDSAPGSSVGLILLNEHSFPLMVESIRLLHGDKCILEHSSLKELPPKSQVVIYMAAIPVRYYGPLSESKKPLDIEIAFCGASEPVMLKSAFPVELPLLKKSPVSLFFDMGSYQFKQMQVELPSGPAESDFDVPYWAESTGNRLLESHNHTNCVRIPAPCPTQEIMNQFALPEFGKDQIDQFDDRQLAAHFATAIQIVTRYYYSRDRRLIADFYMAFPNVYGRDFESINWNVNSLVGDSLLGKIVIAEESECLRRHFADPLNALGRAANDTVQEIKTKKAQKESLEKQNEERRSNLEYFNKQNMFKRIWMMVIGSSPQHPDETALASIQFPTLEEWHKIFMSLTCDPNLSDYLVFDAGGYSLDVYGSIHNRSDRFNYSKSFCAGSAMMTKAIRAKLAEERNTSIESIDPSEAERIKLQYCKDPSRKGALSRLCKDTTREIYQEPIEQVLTWLLDNGYKQGLPVILSGGGSRNQHLCDLLLKHFNDKSVRTVPVNSNLLYTTLKNVENMKTQRNELFLNIVSGFHLEDEYARYSPLTDVIGGLGAIAIDNATSE